MFRYVRSQQSPFMHSQKVLQNICHQEKEESNNWDPQIVIQYRKKGGQGIHFLVMVGSCGSTPRAEEKAPEDFLKSIWKGHLDNWQRGGLVNDEIFEGLI